MVAVGTGGDTPKKIERKARKSKCMKKKRSDVAKDER